MIYPPRETTNLHAEWAGMLAYDDARALQMRVRDAVIRGEAAPTLLLMEHEPVITFGRRPAPGDLLVPFQELTAHGIALRQAERGGQATYHGPGQLVGYLIAPLRTFAPSLPALVDQLETALIEVCHELGVQARRDPRQRGVWSRAAKVGFIGLAITRGVCWHGFSLNVSVDLDPFRLIRPCGLDDEVTSIAQSGGISIALPDLAPLVARKVSRVLGIHLDMAPFTTTS
ncbi:MAG: lipoyl(octanoyl) transferase LipB [Chloroflexi bacterium]|nr:lipoyl(octanoyl) transferase LipB [Chloroflexota bacterium]